MPDGKNCVELTVKNTGTAPMASWRLVLDTGGKRPTQVWNLSPTGIGTQLMVKPAPRLKQDLAAGASSERMGFCMGQTVTVSSTRIVALDL